MVQMTTTKCSRTKFELTQKSSIWFILIFKNQRTLKLELLRNDMILFNTLILQIIAQRTRYENLSN